MSCLLVPFTLCVLPEQNAAKMLNQDLAAQYICRSRCSNCVNNCRMGEGYSCGHCDLCSCARLVEASYNCVSQDDCIMEVPVHKSVWLRGKAVTDP